MRAGAFAVALATAAVAACAAFDSTPEPPAVAAADAAVAPEAGAPTGDAAAEAGRAGPSVACPGRPPCSGAESTCCVSTIGGAVTSCTTPDACFFDGTHPFRCDDASDCAAGSVCCARLDPTTATLAGSVCTAVSCGSSDQLVELCAVDQAAACTAGRCVPNTAAAPKAYAFCAK